MGWHPRRIREAFEQFLAAEASAGALLAVATCAALIWANSPAQQSYGAFWELHLWGAADLRFIVNDVLMAVFFLVVGLEIKRELLTGELSQPRQAALPILAAAGGAIVPAVIFALITSGHGDERRGWGIPMATDIAFAVGILAVLGSRVSVGAKVFLTALAIADDLMAVLVIAVFYTRSLDLPSLGWAGAVLFALFALNRLHIGHLWPYWLLGVALWWFIWKSGVHSTIAGVLLAAAIPARGEASLLDRAESGLHPFVSYAVMPVFALANAGLSFGSIYVDRIATGVAVGLLVGKPIGITLASWMAVKLGWGSMPALVGWRQLHAASWLGGIGFTMSLFIAGLAFRNGEMLAQAKLGIFAGSLAAGLLGSALLLLSSRPSPEPFE